MVKGKSYIENLTSSETQGEISINLDFKLPNPFITYAVWNIKNLSKDDKQYDKSYGPLQIPPDKKGLYVLYDKNNTALYVGINDEGKQSSLNTSLKNQMINTKFKDYIYRIDTYLIDEHEKRKTMKHLLINTLFPIFNRDTNLNKTREEEYMKNPCIYDEDELSGIEEEAKIFNLSPAYPLIHLYFYLKYQGSSVPNDDRNLIQPEVWVNYIAEENKISQVDVFNHAYQYLNLVKVPGDEYNTPFEELENNIFNKFMVRPNYED
ncbi:hypothetical protein [Cytobacillus sp. IB215316]|uniref:hypothetical protein n=1 Tax=Cytobacillus sp. IB215316 TaxID=3097354 RepID=UPI002A0B4051|nr:hypothetical protein [Cytobacillus sp. IB215316]MDX8363222.1 hypothetical protein [Cytobacillus sp. IB215316]